MNDLHPIYKIKKLKGDFNNYIESQSSYISEEKIRSGYINKLLEILGWNISNPNEVVEEVILQGLAEDKLNFINSKHRRPDYLLCKDGIGRLFIEAKSSDVNFKDSYEIAFQIRSYSWSKRFPIGIVTNFREFCVYDTSFEPHINQDPQYRTILFTIDDLINEYDRYSIYFSKNFIYNSFSDLESLFSDKKIGNLYRTLDESFFILLDHFRIRLGEGIYKNIPDISNIKLNYYVQIIINRILFIRILEDLNIEVSGTLYSFLSCKNFWIEFVNKVNTDYYEKYDGAIFSEALPEFKLENSLFEDFIQAITIDSPYRFDVIKSEFLAEIYDVFLGKQLYINDSGVTSLFSALSPEGSVPTPSILSKYICDKTILLDDIRNLKELFDIKILDPCVGSGTFILSSMDKLVEKYKGITNYKTVTVEDVKLIIQNCLYGIDINLTALEVLKMTIALKLVTSGYVITEPFQQILSNISQNFCLGNTIVDESAELPFEELIDQIPTNIESLFPEVVRGGGFSYIVTNPPYVEPKHFKKLWPETWKYLKENYHLSDKLDLSMFFVKRFYSLLAENGRTGLIIQKRFFKTNYGAAIRKFLKEKGCLTEIHEFQANKLFKDRITYIACLISDMNRIKESVDYYYHSGEVNKERNNIEDILLNESKMVIVDNDNLDKLNWSYKEFFFFDKWSSSEHLIALKDIDDINIGVGPQVLDSKFYFLSNIEQVSDNLIKCKNRRHEEVIIETELLKPLYRNEHLQPFWIDEQFSVFILFPYDEFGKLIPLESIKVNYPYGYEYLNYINLYSKTARVDNKNEFYRYTRETKLNSFARPKVFVPMTSLNVTASFSSGSVFGDNSNITTIMNQNDDEQYLKALCVILNSEIFNSFAHIYAAEASNGYLKMNKQFLEKVSIPKLNHEDIILLASNFDEIIKSTNLLKDTVGDKFIYHSRRLEKIMTDINQIVKSLYKISEKDIHLIKLLIEEGC